MYQSNKNSRFIYVLLMVFVFYFPLANSSSSDRDTYKHVFTEEGRKEAKRTGTMRIDPHVWVYNESFGKRWGMPPEWMDKSLKDVEALAFRIDTRGMRRCGYFRESNNCRPDLVCRLDAYFKADANLPWNTDHQSGVYPRFRDTSLHYLIAQDRTDHYAYREDLDKIKPPLNVGISYSFIKSRKNGLLGLWNSKWYAIPYNSRLVEYYRNYLKGLDYLSFSLNQ